MEVLRSFTTTNRGSIINTVYVIAFLIALYYLYKFLMAGSHLEVSLLDSETDANTPQSFPLPSSDTVRVKAGGEYTVSFWMYINSWDYRAGLAKSVLQIVDSGDTNNSLLTTILYPNESKLMVRVHTDKPDSTGDMNYNDYSNFDQLLSGKSSNAMFSGAGLETPMCDLANIDLQRWINITVSVNGRIVDVYYDGKLARSCVLPDIPVASASGRQAIAIGQKGGFGGKVSGIQFFARSLTPDRIYSIYQAGPRGAAGFLGYLADKIGIRMTYAGSGGAEKGVTF